MRGAGIAGDGVGACRKPRWNFTGDRSAVFEPLLLLLLRTSIPRWRQDHPVHGQLFHSLTYGRIVDPSESKYRWVP